MHLDAQSLTDLAEVQPRSAPIVDVICRVAARSHLLLDHAHEVYIESVTLPGRVTHRHWNTLARLGEQEALLVEEYRSRFVKDQATCFDTEVLPVEVFATPVSLKQLNVDQRSEKPPVVLALAEPMRVSDFHRVLRFKDIYLRYDSSLQRIISTLGPYSREIAMTYTSPISPSYNRRLHFLRYISLMGHPVLVAPKWFLLEASQRCHLPRIYLENLVVTPERWAIPTHEIASVLTSHHWTQRYIDLHIWRKRTGLPDMCFAYTNRKTKPLFVDFDSPSGLQNVLELVSQEAEALLFEECYPGVDQQILQRGTEPVFSSIVATIRQTVRETVPHR
jgi:Lantibiotic dehydratase, N terminus